MPPGIKDLDLGEGKKGWAVESRLWHNTAAKMRTAGNSKQVTSGVSRISWWACGSS